MCIQQGHTFIINSQRPGTTSCSATTGDKIELEQVVKFETSDIGLNVYPAWLMVGGVEYTANVYNVTSATTQTFVLLLTNLTPTVYKIDRSYVSYLGYPQCSPTTYTYGCNSLTVTVPPCNNPSCNFIVS